MGKGQLWPFAQAHHPEDLESSTAFGFCLSAFPLPEYAFPLLAYRELGPSVSEEGASPSLQTDGDGKGEKGARNLKSRFQFFLRFCGV